MNNDMNFVTLINDPENNAKDTVELQKRMILAQSASSHVPKSGRHGQGYNYATIDDLTRTASKAFRDSGLSVTSRAIHQDVQELKDSQREFVIGLRFLISFGTVGFVSDAYGYNRSKDDKGMEKANSFARKSFYKTVLHIDTGDHSEDPDWDGSNLPASNLSEEEVQAIEVDHARTRLVSFAESLGLNRDDINKAMNAIQCESYTLDMHENIVAALVRMVDDGAPEVDESKVDDGGHEEIYVEQIQKPVMTGMGMIGVDVNASNEPEAIAFDGKNELWKAMDHYWEIATDGGAELSDDEMYEWINHLRGKGWLPSSSDEVNVFMLELKAEAEQNGEGESDDAFDDLFNELDMMIDGESSNDEDNFDDEEPL